MQQSVLRQRAGTRLGFGVSQKQPLGLIAPLKAPLGFIRHASSRHQPCFTALSKQSTIKPSHTVVRNKVVCKDSSRVTAHAAATQSQGDDPQNPLEVAVEAALALLSEKEAVREALEAEAQEVAQIAVAAAEAYKRTQEKLTETSIMLEESMLQQQQYTSLVSALKDQLGGSPNQDQKVVLDTELSSAQSKLDEVVKQLSTLKQMQADLQSTVAIAADKAAKAEQVASAAMQAAETAVNEELQAAAVVKETQDALNKAMAQLHNLGSRTEGGAAAAASQQAAASSSTGTITSMDEKERVQETVREAVVEAAAAEAPPFAGGKAGKESSSSQLFKLALVIAAATGAWWIVTSTAFGQQASAFVMEKLSHIHIHEGEKGVIEAIWLLFSSIICVPLVVKLLPGGNPVLGYLLAGGLVGPHAMGLIQSVDSVKHLAELGVVFLLFNIGLELSLDRLQSMAKYVFGMGTMQVVLTIAGVGLCGVFLAGLSAPSSIILGGALAMSSTAVAIQVLEDRGEMGSRHGRGTFSVLLLQDLAVVVLLMLIPLLAPSPDGTSGGMAKIAKALGLAAIKACVCIVGIIAGGRLLIQPLYKKMSSFANAEIFAATTLLVVLGTSVLTSLAGLSLALGAFLAGLLIAETEYALQVESDIAPYKGLLLGLFFMSVGMEMNAQLFVEKWREVLAAIFVLIVGKVMVMWACGKAFGLSALAAIRAGLLLAPGGEFAFVAFGEAVSRGVLPAPLTNQLYLVVALSMALTPYLAEFGSKLAGMFEKGDMKALQPQEEEMKEMKDHVIIAGYGRAGQLIGQLLSENLIPFVALDVSNERVATGKAQDLPVYFGDAGSPAVLHLVGAERAACAVIALDTPGANYRAVWAMNKHFPHVKTYVRAHDVNHALNLEKAGATAVVPEILEPALQLAASVLNQLEWKEEEVSSIMDDFRRKHLAELRVLAAGGGTSLGYGYSVEQRKEGGAPSSSSSSSGRPESGGGSTGGLAIAGASA